MPPDVAEGFSQLIPTIGGKFAAIDTTNITLAMISLNASCAPAQSLMKALGERLPVHKLEVGVVMANSDISVQSKAFGCYL